MLKLRTIKKLSESKKMFHRKNNSMNLDEDPRNININLSINNFSIVNKKNKNKHMYHSQDKVCEKELEEFNSFKEELGSKLSTLKFKKNSMKNEARCKTLVDEESCRKIEKTQSKSKILYKKLSKDNLFDSLNNNESTKIRDSKIDLNFMKKNLKLRKSQDKTEKTVRFNTEAYDK